MGINWFVAVAGVLYVLASIEYGLNGHYKMMAVFLMYAVANFVLSAVKE